METNRSNILKSKANFCILISLLLSCIYGCQNDENSENDVSQTEVKILENEFLDDYPHQIDSIIQSRLELNYGLKYYEIEIMTVYHPAIMTYIEENGIKKPTDSYIDRDIYSIGVVVDLIGEKEEWRYELDHEFNLITERQTELGSGGYTESITYTTK